MKLEDEIKQSKFVSAHQKAVLNLLFTASWLQAKNNQFLKPFGITGSQFNILRILKGQYPKSLSVGDIKSRMLDRNSDMPRLISRLLAKDLVMKRTCPDDKRASDITISEKGINLLTEVNKHQKKLDSVLALTEAEAEVLSDLLDKSRS